MEIGIPSEKPEIHKNTIEINKNNLEKFIIYSNKNGTRAYCEYKLNKPGDIKTFIDENPDGGFEYNNVRYSFKNVTSETENEYKVLCHGKFLGNEFEPHTMQLGDIELTLKIKEDQLSDKANGVLENVGNYLKKIID